MSVAATALGLAGGVVKVIEINSLMAITAPGTLGARKVFLKGNHPVNRVYWPVRADFYDYPLGGGPSPVIDSARYGVLVATYRRISRHI